MQTILDDKLCTQFHMFIFGLLFDDVHDYYIMYIIIGL